MYISQSGIDFIKSFEGYHRRLPDGNCTTYYCPAGVLTIGYGSTNMDGGPAIRVGDVWPEDKAQARLRESLERNYEPAVKRLTAGREFTQAQYDMLVSFTYNCGEGCLRQLLSRKTNQGIADALPLFNRGGGRILPGLVRRRADERRIFLNGYANDQARLVEISTPKQIRKEVASSSSKSTWIGRIVGGFAAGVASFFSADNLQIAIETTDKIKEFASANVIPILCIVGVLLFVAKRMYDNRQAKDAMERGNIPSKMEDASVSAAE